MRAVSSAVEGAAGIATVMSEVAMVASTLYKAGRHGGQSDCVRLLETLEELDDVQNVHSNFDMDAEQMEHAAG